MVTNYKECENYSERTDELFDNDPNIIVIKCNIHGIKALCPHKDIWNKCHVSQHDAFYRYQYRLKTRISVHAQLFHDYNYDHSDEEYQLPSLLVKTNALLSVLTNISGESPKKKRRHYTQEYYS